MYVRYILLSSEIFECDTKLYKLTCMCIGCDVFLRDMCFTSNQYQRCNNNRITFLLLTSSVHSVEQPHQRLAAAYQSSHHLSVSAPATLSHMRQFRDSICGHFLSVQGACTLSEGCDVTEARLEIWSDCLKSKAAPCIGWQQSPLTQSDTDTKL